MGRPRTGEVGPAQYLEGPQIKAVAEALPPRDRIIFLLCLRTRCRVSEILLSKVRDVWAFGNGAEQENPLSQLFLTGNRTKTRTARAVPLGPAAQALIREWIQIHRVPRKVVDGNEWLFPGRFPGTHYTYKAFEKNLVKVRVKLGLPGLRSHSARRTAMTREKNLGTDIATIQRLAGHKNLATTNRYLAENEQKKIEATRALDADLDGVLRLSA